MESTILVPIMLFGWIPVVLGIFMLLPPRRATIVAFVVAWLFLPMAAFRIEGWTEYSKMTATCLGVLLAAVLFDIKRLLSFRPHWFDIPALLLCLAPFFASLSNDLGAYDGTAGLVRAVVRWGLAYLIGRVYFSDAESLKELAVGIFLGGVVYVPLCLLEMRMSPSLHLWFYGYQQHDFIQSVRGSWYRPMVFMQHGLMVAMWLTAASLCGIWLRATGAVRRVFGIDTLWMIVPLVLTALACRSGTAAFLLVLGLAVLATGRWFRTSWPVLVLVLMPLVYIAARASDWIKTEQVVAAASYVASPERVDSLQYRLQNEELSIGLALQRPVCGWGEWNRGIPMDKYGQYITRDGLWIISFSDAGLIALLGINGMLLLPLWLVHRRLRGIWRAGPTEGAVVVLAILMGLYAIDNLFNAMVNPLFVLAAGGLASHLAAGYRDRARAKVLGRRSLAAASRPRPVTLRGAAQAAEAGHPSVEPIAMRGLVDQANRHPQG